MEQGQEPFAIGFPNASQGLEQVIFPIRQSAGAGFVVKLQRSRFYLGNEQFEQVERGGARPGLAVEKLTDRPGCDVQTPGDFRL